MRRVSEWEWYQKRSGIRMGVVNFDQMTIFTFVELIAEGIEKVFYSPANRVMRCEVL